MVAAAVPRNRSSTKVVSSAPPTLPTVESANTPPAVREGSAPPRASVGEQHGFGEEPADRRDARKRIRRDLRQFGNRQPERQQRPGVAQPEGR